MLRWVVLAVLVVVLTTAATLVMQFAPASSEKWKLPIAPASKGPMPKVVVEGELTYEFGTMTQQSEGKHSWVFRNEGEADLELWKGTSTCMCTFAKFKNDEKAVLKPGETTDIDVVWRTNNSHGEFKKGANILTNDLNMPSRFRCSSTARSIRRWWSGRARWSTCTRSTSRTPRGRMWPSIRTTGRT